MSDPEWLDDSVLEACHRLGWERPRPQQIEVLEPIYAGKNVVGVLPTSGGKSGIFQIPSLSRPGLTVVVSPLVALMQDQVDRLKRHGVAAYALNSHCQATEKREAVSAIEEGNADIVYLSPERMQGLDPSFFGKSTVQMFAIDEAHCISEWGHDFRPPYLRIGRYISRMAKEMEERPQIVALTATATYEVLEEIQSVLELDDPVKILNSPDRPNITYGVAGSQVSLVRLVETAGRVVDQALPCLVYGSTRKSVEAAAIELRRSGFRAEHYHAGLSKTDRAEIQDRFVQHDIDILTATCAFGMGIDHGSIRSVIHLEMPTSLEAYMQESGRAGRDGSPSIAICRATLDTLRVAQGLVRLTWPTPRRVRMFWHALQHEFRPMLGKWEGEGAVQKTNAELANSLGFDEREVGACLRILHIEGALKVIPYQDRPVEVQLLQRARSVTGRKQKIVVERLLRHADEEGRVMGSIAFFSNMIGIDKTYLQQLNAAQVVRFKWIGSDNRCQLIKKVSEDEVVQFDTDRILAVRARSLNRIEAAKKYLSLSRAKCRRTYLLSYFGYPEGGSALSRCCDHCPP